MCVCKLRQARPRTSRQPICVERTVSVDAQLSSYMIPQCSWVLLKKKEDREYDDHKILDLKHFVDAFLVNTPMH